MLYPICRICGLADVGKLAFQPLTPMFHMLDMRPGQPAYMEQLARAFEALRQAVTGLQLEYEASPLAVRKAASVPYPLLDSVRHISASREWHVCWHAHQCGMWALGLSYHMHVWWAGGQCLVYKDMCCSL